MAGRPDRALWRRPSASRTADLVVHRHEFVTVGNEIATGADAKVLGKRRGLPVGCAVGPLS